MAVQDIATLKSYFETSDVPTQAQFVDLMDTLFSMAPKASPTFTGVPAAPTAALGTDNTQLANTAFVAAAVLALIAGAPANLNTLDELAAAIGDDPVFSATVATALTGKQALHGNLTALAALSFVADRLIYGTGVGTIALATLTAAGRALLDDADASAQLTTLGVSAFIKTLVDDADAATARTTLGLGTAANPQFATIELGNTADTTLARPAAGRMTIEGAEVLRSSATQGGTGAVVVQNLVTISQEDYDALGTPDVNTLYVIDG